MNVTRLNRPIMSLLAPAVALAASSLSAAAQSGSEAVICVGSETRTLATNPIRRVYGEDMEVVYRTGVDIGQRAQIERTLSSELGSYPEVWCAWSELGDPGPQRRLRHGLRCGRNPGDDHQPALQQPVRRERVRNAAEGDGGVAEEVASRGQCTGARPAGGKNLYGGLLSRLVLDGWPTSSDTTCGILRPGRT